MAARVIVHDASDSGIKMFNGDPADLETWLLDIERWVSYIYHMDVSNQQFTDKAKDLLPSITTEDVQRITKMMSFREKTNDWERFKRFFRNFYGDSYQRNPLKVLIKIMTTIRGPAESILEFSARVDKLLTDFEVAVEGTSWTDGPSSEDNLAKVPKLLALSMVLKDKPEKMRELVREGQPPLTADTELFDLVASLDLLELDCD